MLNRTEQANFKLYAHLGALLFILPYILQRLFIGGEGEYYTLPHIPLRWLGYVCNIAIILLGIRISKNELKGLFLNRTTIAFSILFALQLFASFIHGNFQFYDFILSNLRGWLWVASIYIYIKTLFEAEIFFSWIKNLCLYSGIASLIFLLIYKLGGPPINLHLGYLDPRVQGFTSEPSALAVLFPFAIYLFIQEKKFISALILLITIIASQSVIAYLGLVLIALIFMIGLQKRILWVGRFFLYGAILFTCLIFFYPSAPLSGVGLVKIDSNFSEIKAERKGRNALDRLENVIRNLPEDIYYRNAVSDNSRIISAFVLGDTMKSARVVLYGYGLNVLGSVYRTNGFVSPELGFIAFLLSSFGILFILIVYAITRSWIYLSEIGQTKLLILSVFTTLICSLNSAGGIHSYSFCLISLFLLFNKLESESEAKLS